MHAQWLLEVRRFFVALVLASAVTCVPADPDGARPKPHIRTSAGPRLGELGTSALRVPAALRAAFAPEAAEPVSSAAQAPEAILSRPFRDDFGRGALGPMYRATSVVWQIQDGRLCARGAHNHGVWLLAKLPKNARIEFDASSESSDGDLKVEAWGDGRSAATTLSYTNATSYVFILGGWKNTLNVLARLDEHGKDRAELRLDPDADDPRTAAVEPGRVYHFQIERRDGKTVRFSVDDVELLNFVDREPLVGSGHEHFAFNDWETPVCFDNLDILPLGN